MKHGNTEAHEIKNVCNSKKTKKKTERIRNLLILAELK